MLWELLAAPFGYATVVFLPAGMMFVAGGTALPGIFLGSFPLSLLGQLSDLRLA
jgi:hypothetical protein